MKLLKNLYRRYMAGYAANQPTEAETMRDWNSYSKTRNKIALKESKNYMSTITLNLGEIEKRDALISELCEALAWAEDMIDNIRNGRGCSWIEGNDCQKHLKELIAKAKGELS